MLPAIKEQVRNEIIQFEQACRDRNTALNMAEPDMPLTHHFAPGVYGREIFIPADCVVVGKIHKHAHLNMLMQGHVTVKTEAGIEDFHAPMVMVSKAGTKRALYTHTDTIWVTVHLTESQDLDVIEDEVIAKTYEEFDKLQLEHTPQTSTKDLLWLGQQSAQQQSPS